jgi:hypothetical protein
MTIETTPCVNRISSQRITALRRCLNAATAAHPTDAAATAASTATTTPTAVAVVISWKRLVLQLVPEVRINYQYELPI